MNVRDANKKSPIWEIFCLCGYRKLMCDIPFYYDIHDYVSRVISIEHLQSSKI